jgi:hypothetical protein
VGRGEREEGGLAAGELVERGSHANIIAARRVTFLRAADVTVVTM